MAKFNWGRAGVGGTIGAAMGGPVGAALGALGGGFWGGDESSPRSDYPYGSMQTLYGWANDYSEKNPYDPAAPYKGQLSAPMTGTERQGQNMLSSYLNMPESPTLGAAERYTTNVLSGKYDPRQSPYYKSMRSQIMRDANKIAAEKLHGFAQEGMLHSEPRAEGMREYWGDVQGDLGTLLGSMYETERGRMGEAASLAPTLTKTREDLPMGRIGAATAFGAIPREVQQADLDRQYQEYLRQEKGKAVPYEIFSNIMGQPYEPYAAPTLTQGGSMGGIGDIASTLMLLKYLGGV